MKNRNFSSILCAIIIGLTTTCSDDNNGQPNSGGPNQVTDPSQILDANGNVNAANLISALRGGGYVIYFRHATATSGVDQHTSLEDCSTQRNLTLPQGQAESEVIGDSFRRLQIPMGASVMASMYCRCWQMAEYAFGSEVTDRVLELSGYPFRYDYRIPENEITRRTAAVNRILETIPPIGTNQIIVAHANNLMAVIIRIQEQ